MTLACCPEDNWQQLRLRNHKLGFRSLVVVSEFELRVGRICASKDSSCGNDAQKEHGIVDLTALAVALMSIRGRGGGTNIIEGRDTDTVALLYSGCFESGSQFPDDAFRFSPRNGPRWLPRIDIDLREHFVLVTDRSWSRFRAKGTYLFVQII